MELGRFVQWIVVAVIWVLVLLTMLILTFTYIAAIRPMSLVLVLLAGIVLTGLVVKNDDKFADKLGELSDAEILEVMQAMGEVKESVGIQIDLPLKSKKRKREDIDRAIRNLSDTELLHLKDRLREGNIEEEKLMAWLADQNEMTE